MDFKRHILETFALSERDFDRLNEEFLDHFDATLDAFVRGRHLELRRAGKKNDEIYRCLLREAGERRFSADALTLRRIRRIIYG